MSDKFVVNVDEGTELLPSHPQQHRALQHRFVYIAVFTSVFTFYFCCIFNALKPQPAVYLLETDKGGEGSGKSYCSATDIALLTAAGATAGLGAVAGGFLLVGLSPWGPIAGGLFALNMGSGLVAGSIMSTAQSAAMTGTAYSTGAALGAVSAATLAAYHACIH